MSRAQAEAVIKNIIREIVQECSTRGQIVSETLVAFTVSEINRSNRHFQIYIKISKGKSNCFRS